MKKLFISLICLLVIGCISTGIYLRPYTITNDNKQIEDHIREFMNGTSDIKMKLVLDIDNKKYALITVNNGLGEAELTRGFNNKYKIESIGYSTGLFRDEIVKTNKGKYIILKGMNYNNKIAYARVILEGKEYKIDIPKQEYFMAYCKAPSETISVFLETRNITFYDSNDINITDEVFKVLLR